MNKIFGLFILFFGLLFFGYFTWLGVQKPKILTRYFEINDNFHSDYQKKVGKKTYHVIPPFEFDGHMGEKISNKTFEGKVYVADFFFTRCPGICPRMSEAMAMVAKEFADEERIMFLSHTIDPEWDNPKVLKRYANKLEADPKKWHFVTGDQEDLKFISKKGYFVSAIPGEGAEMSDHSGKFILVDKEGTIRGYYDGIEEEEVKQMMVDIKYLLLEYKVPRKTLDYKVE